ncbi:MAG: tRNA guanosine(34) transglycosylase Tgt [candidate division WOR-3 bacterium]
MLNMVFKIIKRNNKARYCILKTKSGNIETPTFLPVASQGTVKTMPPDILKKIGIKGIITNAYHLHLRPGEKIIKKIGGIHKFMNFKGVIFTDSGGFQVYSLSDLKKIKEEGIEFKSHIDGRKIFFTPEKVIEIQIDLGTDVMMTLDECPPYPVTYEYAKESLDLTIKWAFKSKEFFDREFKDKKIRPLIFGIGQGSTYLDLRIKGIEKLKEYDFDGYCIGGLAVGEPKEEREKIISDIISYYPEEKPRYLMGVGYPEDIFFAVKNGIDIFDSVLPTRNARTGLIFTSYGKIRIRNAKYAEDPLPLDPDCNCYVCKNFSRAYIRHLFSAEEYLALYLSTYHSLSFYSKLMKNIREAIKEGTLEEYERKFFEKYKVEE